MLAAAVVRHQGGRHGLPFYFGRGGEFRPSLRLRRVRTMPGPPRPARRPAFRRNKGFGGGPGGGALGNLNPVVCLLVL